MAPCLLRIASVSSDGSNVAEALVIDVVTTPLASK